MEGAIRNAHSRLGLLGLPLPDFAAIFDALSSTITYDNFKDEILATPHQLKKHKAYEGLWFDIMEAHRKVHTEGPA
jgi:hypothetical protein